jgi:hypothetical protein
MMISPVEAFDFMMTNIFTKCKNCDLYKTLLNSGADMDYMCYFDICHYDLDKIPMEDYVLYLKFVEELQFHFIQNTNIFVEIHNNNNWIPFAEKFFKSFGSSFSFKGRFTNNNNNIFCCKCLEEGRNQINIINKNTIIYYQKSRVYERYFYEEINKLEHALENVQIEDDISIVEKKDDGSCEDISCLDLDVLIADLEIILVQGENMLNDNNNEVMLSDTTFDPSIGMEQFLAHFQAPIISFSMV